ncbi:hypothetical protein GOV13_05375 [Candidatus Pacearchaeota archaeon]|nr:hypothetical protein [Candidatus Pacearchaeota archaeon]
MRKERVIMLCLIFSVIMFSSLIYACDEDQLIMKLSNDTNAHGEIYDGVGGYLTEICYDVLFEDTYDELDPHSCIVIPDSNKVIGLSNDTNAHGEVPENTNYATPVCYGDLECENRTGACDEDQTCIVTLSSGTNAHLAACDSSGAYNTKICCISPSAGIAPGIPYWANIEGNFLTKAEVMPEVTTLVLSLIGVQLGEGANIEAKIYEYDWPFEDQPIKTLYGTSDVNGEVRINWTASKEDLDFARDGDGEFDNFYFIMYNGTDPVGTQSGDLNITEIDNCDWVTYCMHYSSQTSCSKNVCQVENISAELNNPSMTCGKEYNSEIECYEGYGCSCKWNGEECGPNYELEISDCAGDPPNKSIIGSCDYNEDSEDDCGDGSLTYSWEGDWAWDILNSVSGDPGDTNYIEDPIGSDDWHYDPLVRSAECVNGGSTVPCPARVQLPFFGFYNFVGSLILICLVYGLLIKREY